MQRERARIRTERRLGIRLGKSPVPPPGNLRTCDWLIEDGHLEEAAWSDVRFIVRVELGKFKAAAFKVADKTIVAWQNGQ